MPEIPNVVMDEVIESEWGNDIRDRTIQRYASVTERTSLVPSPQAGDLAFMENTGDVWVYYSGWKLLGGGGVAQETDTSGITANANTTGSATSLATANLTIPSHWLGYKVAAEIAWTAAAMSAGTASGFFALRIGSTDLYEMSIEVGTPSVAGVLVGRSTGLTATGTVPVILRGRHSPSPVIQCSSISIYARAIRTA